MAEKESKYDNKEAADGGGGLANPAITNRGTPGGTELSDMIGAEKVEGPSGMGKHKANG